MGFLDDLFGVADKTAFVTGGSSGIGRMMAEGLVRAGARVLIASRKGEVCEAVAAELTAMGLGTCEGFVGDIPDGATVAALAAEVTRRTDRLDILINNAGVSWGEPMETFPFEQWTRVMNVNAGAVFTLTRDLMPLLEASASDEDPARIINIGSIMGTAPLAEGAYAYSASKAAVHHITRIFATELAGRRVNCNAFAPGPFPSKMTRFATGSPERAAQVGANVPLGRIGRPEDLQAATLYLCGPGGSYMTGAILPVDGGMSALAPRNLFSNIS